MHVNISMTRCSCSLASFLKSSHTAKFFTETLLVLHKLCNLEPPPPSFEQHIQRWKIQNKTLEMMEYNERHVLLLLNLPTSVTKSAITKTADMQNKLNETLANKENNQGMTT